MWFAPRKQLPVLLFVLFGQCALATTTVAVIDTGIDRNLPNLCKFGHKSFTEGAPLVDTHGHGTHIAGLINRNTNNKDYCLVAIKFYRPGMSDKEGAVALRQALQYAINIKVKIINLSAGGPEPSLAEQDLILRALKLGIKIVVAAGNENINLSHKCNYYPACYDSRIVVVGNLTSNLSRSPSSNYGSTVITRWEIGTDTISDLPGGRIGLMTGTSQATAVATGKILSEMP